MRSFRFTATEVFAIYGRGIVFRGIAVAGSISIGERVRVPTKSGPLQAMVAAVELDRKLVSSSVAGVEIGILLANFDRESVNIRVHTLVEESGAHAVVPVESVLNIDLPVTLEAMGG